MKIIRSKDLDWKPASHENPDNPGCLKKVLATFSDFLPGRLQMVNLAVILPGNAFAAHYHEDMDEMFIILSGNGVIVIDGEESTLTEGEAVIIPRGMLHTMENTGTGEMRYIALGISGDKAGKTVTVT